MGKIFKEFKRLIGIHPKSKHVQVVNQHLSTFNIGGQLQDVVITPIINGAKQRVSKQELDDTLRKYGFSQAKIIQAQKLKIANIGVVDCIEFEVSNGFEARVIVVKCIKDQSQMLNLTIYSDKVTAKYVPPQIQSNYSQSGAQYATRPLTAIETSTLTDAVKTKVNTLVQTRKK